MAQAPSQQDKCAKLAQTFVHSDTCCQKGTMASTKRKADELEQGDEQERKGSMKDKNMLVTYLRRHTCHGHMKKTSDGDMNILKKCQGVYHDMGAAQKLEFASAFKANKRNGAIPAWMKGYVESVMIRKEYMTRSFAI